MKYVLAIKSPIYGGQGSYLAYQFAEALLARQHDISQIFFFQQGVSHANALVEPASDEFNLQQAWRILAKKHRLSLHLCIAAGQRRGIIKENLAEPFVLAGLGEFSKAVLEADRLMTF